MPKQEVSALRREVVRLHKNLDGIKDMDKLPNALLVIDITREEIAVAEAKRLGIPVVAIVDTNGDPEAVDYPIVGNDDAIRSIKVILSALNDAITEGKGSFDKRREPAKDKEAEAEMSAVSA
jgi:small subunit ribosomal protein S2